MLCRLDVALQAIRNIRPFGHVLRNVHYRLVQVLIRSLAIGNYFNSLGQSLIVFGRILSVAAIWHFVVVSLLDRGGVQRRILCRLLLFQMVLHGIDQLLVLVQIFLQKVEFVANTLKLVFDVLFYNRKLYGGLIAGRLCDCSRYCGMALQLWRLRV